MKHRPILFNAEIVRAILDGRKTQTRRAVTPQPELTERSGFKWKGALFGAGSDDRETNRNFAHVKCPFGKVGDRLWVREAFQGPLVDMELVDDLVRNPDKYQKPEFCEYRADGGKAPEYVDMDDNLRQGWRPSIHMPRWASRITLEITSVRVERLNDISETDALAEGVIPEPCDHARRSCEEVGCCGDTAKGEFSALWQSVYGEESWQANPWVWVVEFKMVDAS
ncbi:hypothetical protein [Flyfo siphovirus Tbat2_3]|nr:hypothetical protein [Flyfo siphovirus Tbat2_3]